MAIWNQDCKVCGKDFLNHSLRMSDCCSVACQVGMGTWPLTEDPCMHGYRLGYCVKCPKDHK